jgi:hypothetical protein
MLLDIGMTLLVGFRIASYYIRHPFQCEPDFGVTSVNCDLCELIARGEAPA